MTDRQSVSIALEHLTNATKTAAVTLAFTKIIIKQTLTPKHHLKRHARTCSVLKRSSSGCIAAFWEGYSCREGVRETRHHPEKPNKLPLGSCQEIDPILSDQSVTCPALLHLPRGWGRRTGPTVPVQPPAKEDSPSTLGTWFCSSTTAG